MKIDKYRRFYERTKGKEQQVRASLVSEKREYKRVQCDLLNAEKARELIKKVALDTQKQLEYHLSAVTSLALSSIFVDPYELIIDFVERRNKTECDVFFKRREHLLDPLTSSGGGVADVASTALRVACWSIKREKHRPVILLDEPLRCLSKDQQEKASKMIKELSDKLGIQFIIITQEETLSDYADITTTIGIKKLKSYIKKIWKRNKSKKK